MYPKSPTPFLAIWLGCPHSFLARRGGILLEGLETYLPIYLRQPCHVDRILLWMDQCFNDLFSACLEDVVHGTYTHLDIGACFLILHDRHTKGPSLDYLRQELMFLGSTSLSTYPPAPHTSPALPSNAHPRSTTTPPRHVIPRHLFRHLPKFGGKQLCLKNLTVHGCSLAKCPRSHTIPQNLHEKIREFVSDVSYGGGPCADLAKE